MTSPPKASSTTSSSNASATPRSSGSKSSIKPGGALLLVIVDLEGLLRARGQSRKSGKRVTPNVGKYRADDLAYIVSLAESGRYQAVIDRTYDLTDIVEAHRYVDAGHKKGNVVLRITTPTNHRNARTDLMTIPPRTNRTAAPENERAAHVLAHRRRAHHRRGAPRLRATRPPVVGAGRASPSASPSS